jgi:hypothetical protein
VKRLLIAVALTAALAVPAAAAADTSHATEVVVPRGQPVQIAFADDLTGAASVFGASIAKAVHRRLLEAGMHSSVFASQPREVLPQRGHGLRPQGGAWSGGRGGDDCPFTRVPRDCPYAGGKGAGSVIRALWGRRWTRLPLIFCIREKYRHNGFS